MAGAGAGAAVAGAAADDVVVAVSALLDAAAAELFSDARANAGRRTKEKTPAQRRDEVRIIVEASCLFSSLQSSLFFPNSAKEGTRKNTD
jgi:hypothetical protein